MLLKDCNPYLRIAQIQPAVLERTGPRMAYDYRLFYILENTGSTIIEEQCYELRPDMMIIIPPATAYDFRGQLKTCVLNFDMTRRFSHRSQPLFPPCVPDFDPNFLFETELVEGLDRPFVMQGDEFTRESILRIINQFNTQGPYAEATVSAMLKLLFAQLLSSSIAPETRLSQKIMSYIRTYAATINSNLDVAAAFGYHPVYLGELLKRTTGQTLHSAIVDAKLQLACHWLIGTDEGIDTVAQLAGFCSRTHFCTLFKKKKGISPAEYRRSRQGVLLRDNNTNKQKEGRY